MQRIFKNTYTQREKNLKIIRINQVILLTIIKENYNKNMTDYSLWKPTSPVHLTNTTTNKSRVVATVLIEMETFALQIEVPS